MQLIRTPLMPPTPACIPIMQLLTGTPTLICTHMRARISRALPILIKVSQLKHSHDKKRMSRRCIHTRLQPTTARLLMALLVPTQVCLTILCTPCTIHTVITHTILMLPCQCTLLIVSTTAVTLLTR